MATNKREVWLNSQFKVKEAPSDKTENTSLVVAGFANTVTEDRAGDLIPKSAWETDNALGNYLKNPIVLFQHDHDEPIGKMINYEIRDEGLWVEIEIYNVDDRVYRLVEEGVLRAFSVGFRIKDYKYDEAMELFVITDLELFEISVVSIPCNQDSLFSLQKSMSMDDFKALKEEAKSAAQTNEGMEEKESPEFNNELEKLAYLLGYYSTEE